MQKELEKQRAITKAAEDSMRAMMVIQRASEDDMRATLAVQRGYVDGSEPVQREHVDGSEPVPPFPKPVGDLVAEYDDVMAAHAGAGNMTYMGQRIFCPPVGPASVGPASPSFGTPGQGPAPAGSGVGDADVQNSPGDQHGASGGGSGGGRDNVVGTGGDTR